MKLTFGAKSLIVFGISILFLILITVFESLLSGFSNTAERILSLVLLVAPDIIGVVIGVLGVLRKEPRLWMAYLGILLNGLFALFQLLVISFAG